MNRIDLVGDLTEAFEFSHELYGEKFYKGKVESKRLSDAKDYINIIVSERLLTDCYEAGDTVSILGEIRSRNGNGHLEVYVFPEVLKKTNELHRNEAVFEGYVSRPVKVRRTPLGRLVADLFVAVHRKNISTSVRSDYIPCICWGRGASFAYSFDMGTKIRAHGRLQSRTYTKRIREEMENSVGQKMPFWRDEERTVYEVSMKEASIISEDN